MFNNKKVQKLFRAGVLRGLEIRSNNGVQELPELIGKLEGRGVEEGTVSDFILEEGVPIGNVKKGTVSQGPWGPGYGIPSPAIRGGSNGVFSAAVFLGGAVPSPAGWA